MHTYISTNICMQALHRPINTYYRPTLSVPLYIKRVIQDSSRLFANSNEAITWLLTLDTVRTRVYMYISDFQRQCRFPMVTE